MIQHVDYAHKTTEYFQQTQMDVLKFIPEGNHTVLDLGCGAGQTGRALKTYHRAQVVHGIELVPEPAEQARSHLDSVLTGNLETLEFPFASETFDYIVATDVLEHLIHPDQLLQRIQPLLKPGGRVVASVPNMQHLRVLWHLGIQGDWKYQDSGPFDRTHLRFFTRKSFHRLFTENGYEVEETYPVLLAKARLSNRLTFGMLEHLLAFRYMCSAIVSEAGRRSNR